MRDEMLKAGLSTPPIIESDRDRNEFDLILLPHHLLDKEALEWLSRFKDPDLTDAQRRALVFTYEVGAITNQDYRQLNGTDTLAASAALRRLRDTELLAQKGKGNGTYYVLGSRITEPASHTSLPDKEGAAGISLPDKEGAAGISLPDKEGAAGISLPDKDLTPVISLPDKEGASLISLPDKEGASQVSPLSEGLNALPKGFPKLPEILKQQILKLSQRTPDTGEFKEIIKGLCSLAPLKRSELAKILGRKPKHLSDEYLSEMIQSKELIYIYPNNPTHPNQAYKTPDI